MCKSFNDFRLKEPIRRALSEAEFDRPTEIQQLTVPVLLRGGDLIGIAQTGTGKTVAFLLPILQNLEPDVDGPQAVVVCPTRELAIQVAGEAERFGKHLGARTVLAYGGTSRGAQQRELASGCDIVVATPGRLLDFLTSAWLSLRKLKFLVLDEADRMLDMGFINEVDAILRKAPLSRQTMLFSATFPEGVRRLSERYMFHPETVRARGAGSRIKESVVHVMYPVAEKQKVELLLELLERERDSKILVFTARRESTSTVARRLRSRGHEVVSLSSLLSQANRERALEGFRTGSFSVLVATDVAARGLDITDIDLVVNFDVPMQAEDYLHRVGRTGRAEREGKGITLVSEADRRRVGEIESFLGYAVPRVRLEGFDYQPLPRARGGRGSGGPGGGRRRGDGRGRSRGRGGASRGRSGRGRSGSRSKATRE